jgi:hypothetical protein
MPHHGSIFLACSPTRGMDMLLSGMFIFASTAMVVFHCVLLAMFKRIHPAVPCREPDEESGLKAFHVPAPEFPGQDSDPDCQGWGTGVNRKQYPLLSSMTDANFLDRTFHATILAHYSFRSVSPIESFAVFSLI